MNWNWKKTLAVIIMVAVVLGAFGLIKVMPFWATLSSIVSLIAGFVAAWLFKDRIEEVVNIPDADEMLEKFKEWFASLTSTEASKAVAAAKKVSKTTKKE